jgi:hypothetical protein
MPSPRAIQDRPSPSSSRTMSRRSRPRGPSCRGRAALSPHSTNPDFNTTPLGRASPTRSSSRSDQGGRRQGLGRWEHVQGQRPPLALREPFRAGAKSSVPGAIPGRTTSVPSSTPAPFSTPVGKRLVCDNRPCHGHPQIRTGVATGERRRQREVPCALLGRRLDHLRSVLQRREAGLPCCLSMPLMPPNRHATVTLRVHELTWKRDRQAPGSEAVWVCWPELLRKAEKRGSGIGS